MFLCKGKNSFSLFILCFGIMILKLGRKNCVVKNEKWIYLLNHDILIRTLKKLNNGHNFFKDTMCMCTISLIKFQKKMGLFLRKIYLLRCWGCLEFDWDSYIIYVAKTTFKKILVLICSMKFLFPEVALYLRKSTTWSCMK